MMKSKYFRLYTVFVSITLLAVIAGGCVRRRMTVRSNPPGATVYLDGKEIGRTPLSTNFHHYGKREFRLVKQGYETKTVILPVRAPWYQWPGIDFFSEVLLPGKLTDRHFYEFDMHPEPVIPKYELVGRAEDLRRHAQSEGAGRSTNGNMPIVTSPTTEAGSLTPYTPGPATPSYSPEPVFPIPAPPNDPDNYTPPRF